MHIRKKILKEINRYSSLSAKDLQAQSELINGTKDEMILKCLSTQDSKRFYELIIEERENCKELIDRIYNLLDELEQKLGSCRQELNDLLYEIDRNLK